MKLKDKKKIRARWVKMLRSGKYKQGQGKLHQTTPGGDMFCCLGVLCELAVKCGVVTETVDTTYPDYHCHNYGNQINFLPSEVVSWSGLLSRSGQCSLPTNCSHLSTLNDQGTSFEKIADLIEKEDSYFVEANGPRTK